MCYVIIKWDLIVYYNKVKIYMYNMYVYVFVLFIYLIVVFSWWLVKCIKVVVKNDEEKGEKS